MGYLTVWFHGLVGVVDNMYTFHLLILSLPQSSAERMDLSKHNYEAKVCVARSFSKVSELTSHDKDRFY